MSLGFGSLKAQRFRVERIFMGFGLRASGSIGSGNFEFRKGLAQIPELPVGAGDFGKQWKKPARRVA